MNFGGWRRLAPEEAAREVQGRLDALAPAQRRAAIASMPSEAELASRFAAAPSGQPLSGVPFFLKDLFDVAGEQTLAGSAFLAEVRPAPVRDSAIAAAFRSAGAVLVGKTHLYEFAYGMTGENPHYGNCEHPRFPGRTTGGSSSGSALVVAAGAAPLAIGSDTGGSIRVPAAFCGLYGFRGTPGDAWIADAFPLAPSFDTAGWFTAEPGDMRTTLEAFRDRRGQTRTVEGQAPTSGGQAPTAPTSGGQAPTAPTAGEHVARREDLELRNGLNGCYMEMPGLEPDVSHALGLAARRLSPPADSATAGQLSQGFKGSVETYTVLQSLEALEVHRPWLESHRSRYAPEVLARIERAKAWTPAQIEAAQSHLESVRRLWGEFFKTYDFLVLPATPFPAMTRAETNAESRLRLLALTTPGSLGGHPILTVPVTLPSGLTTGLQVVVKDAESPVLMQVLDRFERR